MTDSTEFDQISVNVNLAEIWFRLAWPNSTKFWLEPTRPSLTKYLVRTNSTEFGPDPTRSKFGRR